MVESSNLHYLKVPYFNVNQNNNQNLHIVGIIDASGSMEPCWEWLVNFWNTSIPKTNCHTITFDNQVKVCKTNKLSLDIMEHGGKSTLIPEVFIEFEKHLDTLPQNQPVTAIFISDGDDNNLKTLEERLAKLKGNPSKRQLNFICLGIQDSFPYFLSMRLRNLYHNGDQTIPALYLIEYASEKAFFNKFEGMKKYFYATGSVQIEPSVMLYPFEEGVYDRVYEGQWVILKSPEVKINNQYTMKAQDQLSIDDVVELFRGWVQQLMLVNLQSKDQAQEYAKQTLKEMNILIEGLNQQLGIDMLQLSEMKSQENVCFYDRARQNYAYRYGNRIAWFFTEVQKLSEGNAKSIQDEFEAAKLMNIGTITGKYQQKALALKIITQQQFQTMVKEFTDVYKKIDWVVDNQQMQQQEEQIQQQQQQQQQQQNQQSWFRQILSQKDFLTGLNNYVKNQFDFIECFPLKAIGARVKRAEGTETNPWNLQLKNITSEQIEMIDLIQTKLCYKNEQNSEFPNLIETALEKTSELNCLIPLLNESDSNISELMNTQLMQFLLSFIVTNNVDDIYGEAYLSLIGQFLEYLFTKPQSQTRNYYIRQAINSLKIVYKHNKQFNKYCEKVKVNTELLFQDNNQKKKEIQIASQQEQKLKNIICPNPQSLSLSYISIRNWYDNKSRSYKNPRQDHTSLSETSSPKIW